MRYLVFYVLSKGTCDAVEQGELSGPIVDSVEGDFYIDQGRVFAAGVLVVGRAIRLRHCNLSIDPGGEVEVIWKRCGSMFQRCEVISE